MKTPFLSHLKKKLVNCCCTPQSPVPTHSHMADSTCVMHPFSYPKPPFSNDTHQENPIYGIGESVSFGRYVSEELEWEKWSSFDSSNNRNRYVKEAEKYSKPGSVAQKKAYFEAHFKRMAALKAAALLEQANAVENCSIEGNDFEQPINNEKEVEKYDDKAEFVVHQNELYFNCVGDQENPILNEIEGKTEDPTVVNPNLPDKSELHSAFLKIDDCKASKEQIPLLQENCSKNKEKSAATVTKNNNPPISPPRSTNLIHPGKENYTTPIKKSSATDPDKKRTPLRVSINRELNRIISPVIKKLGSSSKASTPPKVSVSTPQPPPMTPDLTRRGASPSSSCSRNKIRSPIIPNSFCRTGDRTARRKQKLEYKFNATATEKPSQPSKFKIKAEAELNKFRQSFCFKVMSSPDYYGENGTFESPKQKSDFVKCKSPRERQSNRSTSSQNTSALPPRKPGLK